MKDYFDYQEYYFRGIFKSKFLKPFEYIVQSLKTVYFIIVNNPKVIWIQLPPTPLLYIIWMYKILNKKVKIISDCHNGMFRSPWINTPFAKRLINKVSTIILVHNEDIYYEVIREHHIDESKCYILEDKVPKVFERDVNCNINKSILFPASFNMDEPIKEIIESAKTLSDFTFYITGEKEKAIQNHNVREIPENVKFTGWLSNEDYKKLFSSVDIILGLTLIDGIQLSVANEAVGNCKAMVLSNTNTLKKLFYKGAVYVDPTPTSISAGIIKAIEHKELLIEESTQLRTEREKNWIVDANKIKSLIG